MVFTNSFFCELFYIYNILIMDNEQVIDTNVWVQLNKNSEIEMMLYDYKNTIKYDIDIVLKVTLDELQKIQNPNIPYEETFKELNMKYKNDILWLLNDNKEEKETFTKIISYKIKEILQNHSPFSLLR